MIDDADAKGLALGMYAHEPCRICGRIILGNDIAEAIFAGYSDDNKSRAAHKECFESALEIMEPIWQERARGMIEVLKLVPPLLTQIRGFANDAFGGPSSLTDCIDLVLAEVENILTDDIKS